MYRSEEVYKGEQIAPQEVITLEALGGEMDWDEYLEQSNFENKLKKSGYTREEFVNGKVEMLVYDIPLLEIGKTYVIYAAYNETKQKYYAVGTNQGIFMEEYQDKFTRKVPKAHIPVGESIMYTIGLDEIKNNCQ